MPGRRGIAKRRGHRGRRGCTRGLGHQGRRGLLRERVCEVGLLFLTADGGAVPVGELKRPSPSEVTKETPLTPVRKIPKGTRSIQGREARFIAVREPEVRTERIVDCHIAPYQHTEVTGERMLAAAAEAGLRDDTQIHGVFDMGKWIHTQFEEQFSAYSRSALADIIHVTEYLSNAGKVIDGKEKAAAWGQARKQRLLSGDLDGVLADLEAHECDGSCATDEHEKCLVLVAHRYLTNHRKYMDYPSILARDLPIGSGEAESGIRHVIKKRADVAGAWTEANANLMLALITIRASGWWDEFCGWRESHDLDRWHRRQQGEFKPLFRGKRSQSAQQASL